MTPNTSDNPAVMKALKNLLDSLSPEDKQTSLTRSSAPSSPAPESMGIQPPTVNEAASDNYDDGPLPLQTGIARVMAANRLQVLNDRKKKKRKKKKRKKKKKKPLNAFIAYRSYYSPIFSGLTQKGKSGIVPKMWNEEPRKHLFTLLGQAYSKLRNSNAAAGLDKDLLKKFMPAVVEIIPIIPAAEYLDVMGWTRQVTHDGEETLERTDTVASIPDAAITTNFSVEDIIEHCYKTGIAARPSNPIASPGRHAGGAISFAATPSMTLTLRRQLRPSVETLAVDVQAVVQTSTTEGLGDLEFDFSDLSTNYAPTIGQVTADQQQAYEKSPMSIHFHPGINPPILGFDPNKIQHLFDPYDFNQYG